MPAKKKTTVTKRASTIRRRPRSTSAAMADGGVSFRVLVDSIRHAHEHCAASVSRTINTTLTLRNWAIGAYIREYEQNVADRARYGDALIERLAERLMGEGLERMEERELRRIGCST